MTDPMSVKARENLRKSVAQHVAKSGSGAVLVSACTIADLFADLDAALSAPAVSAEITLSDTPFGRGYSTSLDPMSMPLGRYVYVGD